LLYISIPKNKIKKRNKKEKKINTMMTIINKSNKPLSPRTIAILIVEELKKVI
jgi:hypothetical protein